jgi:hypothetical protein
VYVTVIVLTAVSVEYSTVGEQESVMIRQTGAGVIIQQCEPSECYTAGWGECHHRAV